MKHCFDDGCKDCKNCKTVHMGGNYFPPAIDFEGIEGEDDFGLYAVCDYKPSEAITIGEGCYRKHSNPTHR